VNHVHFSSDSDQWPTPKATYDALDAEFHFDLDPCPMGGTKNGLSTLFMPWSGYFCKSHGWVDKNSIQLIRAGMLKVRRHWTIQKTIDRSAMDKETQDSEGMRVMCSQTSQGTATASDETPQAKNILSCTKKNKTSSGMHEVQESMASGCSILQPLSAETERRHFDLSRVLQTRCEGHNGKTQTRSNRAQENSGGKTEVRSVREGSDDQAQTIIDEQSCQASIQSKSSLEMDCSGLGTLQEGLELSMCLLRDEKGTNTGSFYSHIGSELSGDCTREHGSSLSELQHEQTAPLPVRVVQEQGDACPYCGIPTEHKGFRAFVNPPYSRSMRRWFERAHEADIAVYLTPVRTDTKLFHEIILPYAKEIRFLRGRLKFGDAAKPAPFPSMVVVFEKSHYEALKITRRDMKRTVGPFVPVAQVPAVFRW